MMNGKLSEFKVYMGDEELQVADIQIDYKDNPPPSDIPSVGIIGSQSVNIEGGTFHIDGVYDAITHEALKHITPQEAQETLVYAALHKIPLKYWALKELFNIAGWDITPYRWVPVVLKPGETEEHAFRRVQLGNRVLTANEDVVLLPPDTQFTPPDKLF
ncbi:hypothetical protein [Paenibacillus sp. BIC5C1]|uniref:hypothetical protein n=1 Tax=Paenibacillus sp. BIC5C1 TaxID=3078263 RepID=UPI0028E3F39D|nr:hypothetical protein [Paenibacillus sp. BIC5C1]